MVGLITAAGVVIALGVQGVAFAASAETAKADENRKKPLQRCDELADQAQLACLRKARERIVESRSKREASASNGADKNAKSIKAEKSGKADTANAAPKKQ